MSILKKVLKWIGILVVILLIAAFAFVKYMSEDKPEVIAGANADAVTQQMFTALNKPAFDSLKYLKWEFMLRHKYLWDKQGNNAVISFDQNKIVLDLDEISGVAYVDGNKVEGEQANKLIQEAWGYWCNDSFWMFAPFKAFDKGTKRTIVKTDAAKTGLMVSYESGGVTPGDAYLWLLDENYIPTGYKMWTSIIPIGGMYTGWSNWTAMKGGAKLAISHKSKLLTFDMKDVAEGDSPSEIGYENNVFDVLKK